MTDETPSEKPLRPAEMRKAFGGLLKRLEALEDSMLRVGVLETEFRDLKLTKDFFDNLNRKIDRYSLELDQAMPRITHADAELLRAARQIDMILRLVGENAHGVGKIMERMNERTGEAGSEPEEEPGDS